MTINALDHFNVIAADIDATACFYADVLGLERRDGPTPAPATMVQWMHDDAGRAIVHINSVDCPRAYDREIGPGPTGALHHIAFNCSGFELMCNKLDAGVIDYSVNEIPSIGLRQIFIHDPNDIVLELNFFAD